MTITDPSRRFLPDSPGSAAVTAPTPRQARVAAIAALLFMAPLALQWQVLADTPLGIVRLFHIGAATMMVLYLLSVRSLHAIFRELRLLVAAMSLLTGLAIMTALNYGGRPAQAVQNFLYFIVGLMFAAVLYTAMTHDSGRRILVWAAPLSVTWLLIEASQNLAANGVEPLTQVRQAIASVDSTQLIYGVFREGIMSGGSSESASVRHEMMAAIMATILVTLLARRVRRHQAVLATAACATGGVIVLLSLSRAVLLAVAAVGLAAAVRVVFRSSLSRTALALGFALFASLIAVGPNLGRLLYARMFTDTGSYEARLNAFSIAPDELRNRLLAGGPNLDVLQSTHTLFFDALFQSGWLAGIAALVVIGVFVRYTYGAFSRYFDTRSVIDLVAFAAGMLVTVRAFTSGGGYLHQVEWAAFGLLVAIAKISRMAAETGTDVGAESGIARQTGDA